MNWQFWKKTPPITHKSKAYPVPFLLNKTVNYSLSPWEANTHYRVISKNTTPVLLNKTVDYSLSSWEANTHYRVISNNTTLKLLNYNTLLTIDILGNSSVGEDIRQIVDAEMKQIIMKDTIFNNLYKTLDNLYAECEEEGFERFSDIAKENSRKILKAVYENFPEYEYYIYPTEDREIAIDCNPQKGKGILILCDSNGSVAYFSTLAGKNSRFRCDNIEDFPYELLWKTFKELNEEKKYSSNKDVAKKTSSVSYKSMFPSKASSSIYDSPTGIKYKYA